jgi:hypothetical protein
MTHVSSSSYSEGMCDLLRRGSQLAPAPVSALGDVQRLCRSGMYIRRIYVYVYIYIYIYYVCIYI